MGLHSSCSISPTEYCEWRAAPLCTCMHNCTKAPRPPRPTRRRASPLPVCLLHWTSDTATASHPTAHTRKELRKFGLEPKNAADWRNERTGKRWNASGGENYASRTPLQKRTQVWFELQAKIPVAHEVMMHMLQENAKIKKIYRGTLTSVYIYTKKLFSKINNIFY